MLYTEICIRGDCLCLVNSLSARVAVTQLSVLNCRLESNICACFIEHSCKLRMIRPNGFISGDLLRSSLFGIACFGSFRYLTLTCKHL